MKKIVTLFLAIFLCSTAFSQGHYSGSSFNPNDYFAPHAGWIIPLYYGYADMNYYNSAGHRSDRIINPSPTDPTSLNIQQNVKTNSFILMAIYGGKTKILGANWGMMVIPTLNGPTANIALDYFSNQTGEGSFLFTHKSLGFGDVYIQPVWLSWTKEKMSFALNYGVWAPTGRYKAHDLDNSGLGYWSHNIRVAAKVKPMAKISASIAATLELNEWQKGTDFKEGSHLTIDLGGAYVLDARGDEVGVFAHNTNQIGDDKGENLTNLTDRAWGIGGYASYWIKPHKIGLMGRLTQNFGVKNRFGGTAFQVGLNYLILQ